MGATTSFGGLTKRRGAAFEGVSKKQASAGSASKFPFADFSNASLASDALCGSEGSGNRRFAALP
jgi:hypothetical protein